MALGCHYNGTTKRGSSMLNATENIYYTPEEVETYSKGALKANTLKQMRTKKKGPNFIRIGHQPIYTKCDIDQYLEQHKSKHDSSIIDALGRPTEEKYNYWRTKMENLLFGDELETIQRARLST